MYQKRYIAYAKAHGKAPAEMIAFDEGRMSNYIIWIGEKLVAFRQKEPDAFCGGRLVDHDGFDMFLEEKKQG